MEKGRVAAYLMAAIAASDRHIIYDVLEDNDSSLRLAAQGTYDGLWQRHQLFVASATAVHCIFVAAGPATGTPFAEVSLVAHHVPRRANDNTAQSWRCKQDALIITNLELLPPMPVSPALAHCPYSLSLR